MVKHGKMKKRRANRYGKVKLKNKNWNRWNPKPQFNDATVKANWDSTRTPAQNLANLGLVTKVNHDIGEGSLGKTASPNNKPNVNSTVVHLFDVPESDSHVSHRQRFPLSEEDENYIAKCMEKYGDNYTKMFRDTKVNDLQHTEEKLRKLGARYVLLTDAQRRIPVPENVKKLLT